MKIKPKPFLKNKRKEEKKARKLSNFQSKKFLLFFLTIITLSTALGIFVYFADPQTRSATFGWIQEDWSGGNSENTATHENDQTGWSEFSNKEEGVNVSNTGEVTLQNTTHQHTSDTGTDFENWTLSNTEVSGDSIVLKQSDFTCGTSTIQDADGNSYETVQINDQCWMAENMRTTTYPDGTSITKGPSSDGASGWDTDEGYYSCPPNSSNDGEDCAAADSLGMLYQWSAAMTGSTTEGTQGICPDGWHVPTDDEWHALEDYLTADGNTCDSTRDGDWDCDPAGSKLAGNDAEDEDWNSGTLTNHSDFDSSGFNASPSGYRVTNGGYDDRSSDANFWSSSESGGYAWRRNLRDSYSTVHRDDNDKAFGFSVRCLKD